jgi:hypothetical protein
MKAEINRDGMLVLMAQTETERYAATRWLDNYRLGENSPLPWGIVVNSDIVPPADRRTPERAE